jgi:uncharacterized protein (DUF111 family)
VIAYFEMIGGASGNMLLGALLDAGADAAHLEAALSTIPVSGWRFERSRVVKRGIAATYFDFAIPGEDHEAHSHEPGIAPHRHDAAQRRLDDVLEIVARSGLSERQKTRAAAVYRRLGDAEARVHGVAVEEIHFHEVGQVDAILDVAGFCVALDLLGVERLYCSAFPVGRGGIAMAHGLYPNPPPATAELLRGAPQVPVEVDGEMVTTTGAALLTNASGTVRAVPTSRCPTSCGCPSGAKRAGRSPTRFVCSKPTSTTCSRNISNWPSNASWQQAPSTLGSPR